VAVLQSFLMLATIFTVLGTNTSILRLIPEHLAGYFPALALRGKNIGPEFGLSIHNASGAKCQLSEFKFTEWVRHGM